MKIRGDNYPDRAGYTHPASIRTDFFGNDGSTCVYKKCDFRLSQVTGAIAGLNTQAVLTVRMYGDLPVNPILADPEYARGVSSIDQNAH